jgi:hypothetical protein
MNRSGVRFSQAAPSLGVLRYGKPFIPLWPYGPAKPLAPPEPVPVPSPLSPPLPMKIALPPFRQNKPAHSAAPVREIE